MHSYGGSEEITKALDSLYGKFYYSVCMSIANKPSMLDYIKLDKLLLETDAPH